MDVDADVDAGVERMYVELRFAPFFLMNMQSVVGVDSGGGVDSGCLFATSLATLPEGQESRCMQLLLLPSNCSVCVCVCV